MTGFKTSVETLNQILALDLPLPWGGPGLHLRSDRCAGRVAAYRWNVDVPDGEHVKVVFEVAGRRHTDDAVGSVRAFRWDGRDDAGALLVSPQRAAATVTVSDGDGEVIDRFMHTATLGRPDARALGLGGFTPGDLHLLHWEGRTVFTGNGKVRTLVAVRAGENGNYAVTTRDGRRHVFGPDGRHHRTVDLRTGAPLAAFAYDDQGRITEIVRGSERRFHVDRPASDRVTIIGPDGTTIEMSLDEQGTASGVGGPIPIQLEATPEGLVTALTGPLGLTRRYGYEDGRLVRVEDPAGPSYLLDRTEFDDGFQVLRVTGEGRERRIEVRRDASGTTRTRYCCGNRQPTVTRFEDSQRVITRPDGLSVEQTFSTDGSDRQLVFPSGLIVNMGDQSSNGHDRSRRLGESRWTRAWKPEDEVYELKSPVGRVLRLHVDDAGRPVRIQPPDGPSRKLRYDDAGRLTEIAYRSTTLRITHDDAGRPLHVQRDDGSATSFRYDAAGRLVEQTLPGDRIIRIGFDAAGDVTGFAPPGRPATRFSYSAPGQLERIEFPEINGRVDEVFLEHDGDGLITAWTRADGRRLELHRGPGGRPETLTYDDGRIEYGYDPDSGALNRLDTADGVVTRFTWDGPLLSEIDQDGPAAGVIRLEHGRDLLVKRRTVADRRPTAFEHDADGLLVNAGPMTVERDPASGSVVASRVGQVEERLHRDENGLVRQVVTTADNREVLVLDYDYDERGRIVGIVETHDGVSRTTRFAYDAADRLAEVVEDGATLHRFTFDANGNPVRHEHPGDTYQASVDDRDRLLEYGPWKVEHTADGEMVRRSRDAEELTLSYDARGLLVSAGSRDGTTSSYLRDGMGRVVGMGTDQDLLVGFLYDEMRRPVAAVDPGGGPVMEFVSASRAGAPELLIVGDRILRLITDHVGSPRLVLDATTGETIQRMRFDPLGALIEDTNPGLHPFGFAGGLRDPLTGLTFFGIRAYDTQVLRWTSVDPLLFRGRMTNLYGYAAHDPVNHRDPTGTQVEVCRQGTNLGFGDIDAETTGFEHWWLRTSETEAGMAPHPGDSFGGNTAVVDHEGRGDAPGSSCDPVENVDEDCVNEALVFTKFKNGISYGQNTGFWDPVTNTCQDTVADILNRCASPGTEPVVRTDDDFVKWYSPNVDTKPHTPVQEYPSPEAAIESESYLGSLWQ